MQAEDKSIRRTTGQYALAGALIGVALLVSGIMLDIWWQRLPFTVGSVTEVARSQPLHLYLTTAPFVLAGLLGWLGHKHATLVVLSASLERVVQEKTASYAVLINELEGVLRKRVELEGVISRGKKEWEATFDSLFDMLLITDVQNLVVRCNQTAIQKLSYTYQEILSKNIGEVFWGKGTGKHLEAGEVQFPTLEGWYHVSIYPLNTGNELRKIYLIRDRTFEKMAMAEIERQKQYFQTLVNASPVAIVILDMTHQILSCNAAFEKLFGYGEDEILGHDLDELVTVETERKEAGFLTKNVMAGENVHRLAIRHRKDGSRVEVELLGVPIRIEGEMVGALGLYHDVTELVRARQEAEQAAKVKSDFLANMSHEIRTPMNGVLGMMELLEHTHLTAEQKDYLETAQTSAESLLGLLNDILDFSKIEAGQLILENIGFDLRTTVEGVVFSFAKRADEKNLELACLINYDVPARVKGDPARLRQILINLIGNALKFTEKGEVVIRVFVEESREHETQLKFTVTDTGIGIPFDQQNAIFERFSQADSSTTRKYGGSGLGLAICNQLVQMMQGKIGVESEPEKGSTFWFTADFGSLEEEDETPSVLTHVQLFGRHVLVVDDSTTSRIVLRKMLERMGCEVAERNNGTEAIPTLIDEKTQGRPFDLVLLDMQMPEDDAETTIEKIKAHPFINEVSTVVLTSLGHRGDVTRLREKGCEGYLVKPVRQQHLYQALVTVLGNKDAALKEDSAIVTQHLLLEKRRQNLRILLVEDNPVNQKLTVALLTKFGYPVDTVDNGAQAVEMVQHGQYNLILMDIYMPVLDGFEATKQIRSLEKAGQHTPIIAMTANAMRGDRERCLEAGMDDYLSKPIRPDEFQEKLARWAQVQLEALDLPSEPVQQMSIDETLPFDMQSALPRFANNQKLFYDLLPEFFKQVEAKIPEVEDAYVRQDTQALFQAGHFLKGMAGNFSTKRMVNLTLALENAGKEGDLAGIPVLIEGIRAEYIRMKDFYEQLVAQ